MVYRKPTLEDIKSVYPEYEIDWAEYIFEQYWAEVPALRAQILPQTVQKLIKAGIITYEETKI